MRRRAALLTLVAALALTGCSLAPADQVLSQLANSDRSWCVTVSTIYGTLKMGGTGVPNGKAICNGEGYVVDNTIPAPGGTIVIPAPPRVLQQEAPTYREIVPAPPTRAPMIRPQSWPAGPSSRVWELLETSAAMHGR